MRDRLSKGSFSALLLHLHPATIPESSARATFTWCLGGLAALMFLLETLTGILLLLHYMPTAGGAYASMQDITHVVPYGFFLRNIHYWAGQIMVGLVVLHMVRVFWTGSFAPPRQFNWVIGLMLLAGAVLVDFTGYLLVWDARSLWAWTIARNLCGTVPVMGAAIASLLFGPEQVGDAALIRVYVWHVVLLPALMMVLMGWHFWRIRKDGGISQPL
jgi:quinol-cytochrome oxidoreductase complex cytochrome b subunit